MNIFENFQVPSISRRKHSEDLPPAERPYPARLHVPDAASVRDVRPAVRPERGRSSADSADRGRVQDEAGQPDPRPVVGGAQFLQQRLVERPRQPVPPRLPQVRLLPDVVRYRRSSPRGCPRPGRLQHGRAQEEVVDYDIWTAF